LVYAPNQSLIMVNKGAETDGIHSGFVVCKQCGAAYLHGNEPTGSHARHYLIDPPQRGENRCNGTFERVYLGYSFLSDILLLRIPLESPLNLALYDRFERKPLEDALVSLAEAITLAACHELDVDPRELSTGVRFLRAREGMMADIFLFDTLSGGAGYSNMAGQIFDKVFGRVREIMEECDCDWSCHKCLRYYGNRLSHADLNRYLGLDIWRYIAEGITPAIPTLEQQRRQLDPLAQMLELEGWRRNSAADIPVIVERDGVTHQLGSYPSIIDPNAAQHPLAGRALLFSRYELERNLPGAFSRVVGAR